MQELEQVLAQIQAELQLDRERERDLLDEIRDHLETAVAQALALGANPQEALAEAARHFGVVAEVGQALQAVHAGEGAAEGVMAAGLPVLLALVLRWLLFAPDGTVVAWQQVLARPAVWLVALAALLVPLLKWRRWRYALLAWGFFWALTLIFVCFPALRW